MLWKLNSKYEIQLGKYLFLFNYSNLRVRKRYFGRDCDCCCIQVTSVFILQNQLKFWDYLLVKQVAKFILPFFSASKFLVLRWWSNFQKLTIVIHEFDWLSIYQAMFRCDYISDAGFGITTWLLKMPINILYWRLKT